MEMRIAFLLAVATACGAPSAAPTMPANRNASVPAGPSEPGCTRGAPRPPLLAADLELKAVPAVDSEARALLLGTWEGHAFSVDGEFGTPGLTPEPGAPVLACFDAPNRLVMSAGSDTEMTDGCVPRSKTYEVRREPDAGNELVVYIERSGGCPEDAGFKTPYRSPYRVHRLDERFLVLVDGVTGAVTGYRRR